MFSVAFVCVHYVAVLVFLGIPDNVTAGNGS